MSLGLAFWVIVLVAVVFGVLVHFGMVGGVWAGANNVVLLVLVILCGWQIFGAPLHK